MAWPKESRPSSTKYALIEFIRSQKVITVSLILIAGYVLLNVVFGCIHYYVQPFGHPTGFLDCQYFSFITGMTVGYGDIAPQNASGKIIVIIHGILATTYFAVMIAFLSVKFLSPYRTVHFSEKLLFDGRYFCFRILNSHRSLLVNPEVRIAVVLHCAGNVIAPTISVAKIDYLHWLDNHDFVLRFSAKQDKKPNIYDEWQKALSYQGEPRSRFKIRITITGSYGFQQYYQVKSYDASDIQTGSTFSAIAYNDEDKRLIRNIKFKKFPNFWEHFDKIL